MKYSEFSQVKPRRKVGTDQVKSSECLIRPGFEAAASKITFICSYKDLIDELERQMMDVEPVVQLNR